MIPILVRSSSILHSRCVDSICLMAFSSQVRTAKALVPAQSALPDQVWNCYGTHKARPAFPGGSLGMVTPRIS